MTKLTDLQRCALESILKTGAVIGNHSRHIFKGWWRACIVRIDDREKYQVDLSDFYHGNTINGLVKKGFLINPDGKYISSGRVLILDVEKAKEALAES